jgi:hypothetical protein
LTFAKIAGAFAVELAKGTLQPDPSANPDPTTTNPDPTTTDPPVTSSVSETGTATGDGASWRATHQAGCAAAGEGSWGSALASLFIALALAPTTLAQRLLEGGDRFVKASGGAAHGQEKL